MASSKPKRRVKPDADIVLLCNPRAGGRWKELAEILDSEEARHVRRIVTDSVEDIAPALQGLGREAKLLCIYGGDGTIQRILDRLSPSRSDAVQLALIGGGTMNVTARWCGFGGSPAENFRAVVQAYRTGDLLFKEVPLLQVTQDHRAYRGFTFGMGPIVRILDAYERGRKGKIAAVGMALRSMAAVWTGFPSSLQDRIAPMEAKVSIDGERLPYSQYTAVFGNVTGQINPGVEPFVDTRTRDSFYCAAYSVSTRELVLALPFLMRGWLPVDRGLLFNPTRIWKAHDEDGPSRLQLPADPRYVNRPVSHLEIRTREPLYTVDGEIIQSRGELVTVELGPVIKLAVTPAARFTDRVRQVAANTLPR